MGRPDLICNERVSRAVGTCARAGWNHMKRRLIGLIGILFVTAVLLLPSSAGLEAAPQTQDTPTAHQELVNQYCVTCHNQRAKTAGLALDTLNLGEVGKDVAIWEEAVRNLRGGMTPPPGA